MLTTARNIFSAGGASTAAAAVRAAGLVSRHAVVVSAASLARAADVARNYSTSDDDSARILEVAKWASTAAEDGTLGVHKADAGNGNISFTVTGDGKGETGQRVISAKVVRYALDFLVESNAEGSAEAVRVFANALIMHRRSVPSA